MNRVSKEKTADFRKTMIKGGLAAAAPGLMALTAAFTAPVSILEQYAGLGQMGVAAAGILFFGAAYFFSKGHGWAGVPALVCTGLGLAAVGQKALRLLLLYYSHNTIQTLNDVFAPFVFISLQLTLVFIAATLGWVILKAFLLTRTLSPQPVSKLVWGSACLWTVVIVLDCMGKFQ